MSFGESQSTTPCVLEGLPSWTVKKTLSVREKHPHFFCCFVSASASILSHQCVLIVNKQIKKDFHRCELCLYVHLCAYLSRWYPSLHAWAHMEFIFACYLRLALMNEYDELMWGLKRLSWLDKLRCWLAYLRSPVRYLPGRWRHQEKRHSCHISWYCTTLSGEKTLSYIPIQLLGSIQLIAILAIAGKHHSCDSTWRRSGRHRGKQKLF